MCKKFLKAIFSPSQRGKVWWGIFAIFLLSFFAGLLDYPKYYDQGIDWVNWKFKKNLPHFYNLPFRLGLDLQGGAHLIYQADVSKIEKKSKEEAVEGARDVIERRVNAFGVAEPLIQIAKIGDNWQVIVELAGIKDVKAAIKMIGETPLLEFKEENNDPPRNLTSEEKKQIEEYNKTAKKKAEEVLKKIKDKPDDFEKLVAEYSEDHESKLNQGDLGWVRNEGKYQAFYQAGQKIDQSQIGELPKIKKTSKDITETSKEFVLLQLSDKRLKEEVKARHILICYEGAKRCDRNTKKEEAKKQIEDLKKQAIVSNFAELAKKYSTEPGAHERGGDLGWFGRGVMVPIFEKVVFDEMTVNKISNVVETEFGYHLIYKIDERRPWEYKMKAIFIKKKIKEDILPVSDTFKNTNLTGQHLKRAQLQFDPNTNEPMVGLEFNDQGKELFAAITKRNINKPVAIYLDSSPISIPRVEEEIREGKAVIRGKFNLDEAKILVRRLNAGALPVPVKLISQRTVGASLGQESIQKSLAAGLIGLILVVFLLILYYRLPGFLASLSLVIYGLLVIALFKLIPVTLTLAGIAGFILSMGMAVDANILIFERIKEELKKGVSLGSAIDEGFKRAWPSIRDGNLSTLITCLILIWFTTSMVKGFALTLALGILTSMFSALVITRVFLKLFTAWSKRIWWFGVSKKNIQE